MFDPKSIFYPPYLVSAFVVATVWLVRRRRMRFFEAVQYVLQRRTWMTRSTRTDLVFTLGYLLILRAPIAVIEAGVFTAALAVARRGLAAVTGTAWTATLPRVVEGGMATVVTMVAIDFAA